MSHLILAVESTSKGHQSFVKWVKDKHEYSYKNEETGEEKKNRPIPREIRFYNLVVKRNVIPELIDDLSWWNKLDMLSGRSFQRFLGLIRKFLPFDIPYVPKKEDTHSIEQIHNYRNNMWPMAEMGGPLYIQIIGTLPDMINDEGEDML